MPGLTPDQVQKIHQLLHDKQLIQAVKVYHDATGVSLAEAKKAIEEMARNESAKLPSRTQSYDDPVLESKIRSLLSKGKQIEAVKIYREEYRTSLKEAKDAVDRIEASLPREPAASKHDEAAIGQDPFAEEDETGRRPIILLGVVLIIGLCGLAGFLLRLLSNP